MVVMYISALYRAIVSAINMGVDKREDFLIKFRDGTTKAQPKRLPCVDP